MPPRVRVSMAVCWRSYACGFISRAHSRSPVPRSTGQRRHGWSFVGVNQAPGCWQWGRVAPPPHWSWGQWSRPRGGQQAGLAPARLVFLPARLLGRPLGGGQSVIADGPYAPLTPLIPIDSVHGYTGESPLLMGTGPPSHSPPLAATLPPPSFIAFTVC